MAAEEHSRPSKETDYLALANNRTGRGFWRELWAYLIWEQDRETEKL